LHPRGAMAVAGHDVDGYLCCSPVPAGPSLDLATDLGFTQPAYVDLSGHHSQPQPSLVPRLPPT
jgi:hypothetical protein